MQRHRLDLASLVTGVLFGVIGIASFIGNVGYTHTDMAWIWPLAAVALGVALLLGSRSTATSRSVDEAPSIEETRPTEEDS